MADLRTAVEAMLAERYGYGRPPPPPRTNPVVDSAAILRRQLLDRALAGQPCGHVMVDGQVCALLAGHQADGLDEHDPDP